MPIHNRFTPRTLGIGAAVLAVGWLLLRTFGVGQGGWEILRSAKVTRGDLRVTTSASGEVKPQNRVEIKPSIAGRIDEVLVREGQVVAPGDVLAWMSSTDRAALLDAARSQGPETLAHWEDAYKPAPLIAPLAGTIILRAVEPGHTVTPSDPVVVIADRLIVQATVDETDLSRIQVGQRAEVRLDAYPDATIPSTVDHVAYESRLVNNVSVYLVDVLPEQIPETFRSGMTATVTFVVADHPDVLLIPSDAVAEWPTNRPKPEGGGSLAAFRRGLAGRPTPTPIATGESDGRLTELASGLREGDEVLIVRRRESSRNRSPMSMRRSPPQDRPRAQ